MKLYNSKTNQKEDFQSIHPGKVSMYVCGPTVYNHAHIGNARPIVVFDLLRRVLIEQGYDVHYVSNFTDVDDRIIQVAHDEGVNESIVSKRYEDAYNAVRQKLHANFVDATPRVTESIDEIIAFIKEMVDTGYAYEKDGNVYFRVHKISDYGVISSQNIDALKVGARIEANEDKESSLDFVLWKDTDDEGVKWQSPWGMGRPGWHTECVVMIQDEFKMDTIDIHGGGQDLKFPHHDNEAAQAKAVHHHDLANYWVHNAMLNLDGEKMSKSLGNVVWAKDYIEQFGANVTRLLLLSTHYRLILNISDELVEQVQHDVKKIETVLKQASLKLALEGVALSEDVDDKFYNQFMEYLKDDLNIANAMVVVQELVKALNQSLRKKDGINDVLLYTATLVKFMNVLGLDLVLSEISSSDIQLHNEWDQAKVAKDFEKADKLRQALIERGVIS